MQLLRIMKLEKRRMGLDSHSFFVSVPFLLGFVCFKLETFHFFV